MTRALSILARDPRAAIGGVLLVVTGLTVLLSLMAVLP